jgi:Flp pilus assembly CpaE family ATPase
MGVPAERLRLIVNRSGSWGSLNVKDVNKVVGIPVDCALDNDYGAVREAAWNGGLVKQDSALAQQLRELGERILGREQDAPEEITATTAAPTAL